MFVLWIISILTNSLIGCCSLLHGFSCDSNEQLLQKVPISSWTSPTLDDYRKLEGYLVDFYDTNKSELVPLFGENRFSLLRNFKFVARNSKEIPGLKRICFGDDENNTDECIICYASCSSLKNYAHGIERLVDCLKKVGYKGHLLYRIGGWPGTSKGSLLYFNVPYSFKVFFLDEARDLGYKKVLWLDASMCPEESLSPVFKWIEDGGFVFWTGTIPFSRTVSNYLIEGMNVSADERKNIQRYASGVIGLNFTMKMPNRVLDAWLNAVALKIPFYSIFPEEGVLSVVLYRLKIQNCDFSRQLFFDQKHIFTIRRLKNLALVKDRRGPCKSESL